MPGATTALAVVLVIGSAVLAGCGESNPYALPKYGPAAAAVSEPNASPSGSGNRSVSVSPGKTPPEVKYQPADPLGEGAWVERGKINANTPAERAAVRALTEYLSARVQLSNTWKVNEPALEAVSSGAALISARRRAQDQRTRDWRSIGRFIINVSSVKVSGSKAAVTGCHFDATSEVDQNGDVVIAPPGGVLLTMHLRRSGGTWRVIDWPTKPVPFCDWRH